MEFLEEVHQEYFRTKNFGFRRSCIDEIMWNSRMLGIKGARGVGKSTVILQHIQEKFGINNQAALYVSMDHIMLQNVNLLDIAKYHAQRGGTHLFIDEIHKVAQWSLYLKTIYDTLPKLNVVFSSSSILEIYKSEADLSRRVILYELKGLSFREYLQIETKQSLQQYKLTDIYNNHLDIAHQILQQDILPLKYFKSYLSHGYYPYYLEDLQGYNFKLNNVINLTLEVDLVQINNVDIANIRKLQKLLLVLAASTPFTPNISKLAESLGVTRNTVVTYLYYLQQAALITPLNEAVKAYKLIGKPDKVYLQNTNLIQCLQLPSAQTVGNLRETFFANQVGSKHQLNSCKSGDFFIDETYTAEIGGKSKDYKQIANIPNSFVAQDDIEIGIGKKIPLWLFGFLY